MNSVPVQSDSHIEELLPTSASWPVRRGHRALLVQKNGRECPAAQLERTWRSFLMPELPRAWIPSYRRTVQRKHVLSYQQRVVGSIWNGNQNQK